MWLQTLALGLTLVAQTGSNESATGNEEFDFYFGEFVTFEVSEKEPQLGNLIMDRLAESMFNTNNGETFRTRLALLKKAYYDHPLKRMRFNALDARLQVMFESKMKAAKRKRWIYTASGALAGALIAIPIGKVIASSASTVRLLTIAVPIGAVTGAGAGYLLGSLLAMPKYEFTPGSLTTDLEVRDQLISEIGGEK